MRLNGIILLELWLFIYFQDFLEKNVKNIVMNIFTENFLKVNTSEIVKQIREIGYFKRGALSENLSQYKK